MKKTLLFLLSICMIFSSFAFCVSAEEYEEYDGMLCVKGELVLWTNVYVEPVICEDGESVDFFGVSVTEIDALFTVEDGGADRWAELSNNKFPYCIKVASDVDIYEACAVLSENENIIEVGFNPVAYPDDEVEPPVSKTVEFTESVFEFENFNEQAMSDLGFEPTLYGKDSEPIIIDSRETIEALSDCDIDTFRVNDPTFDDYFAKYDEAFFDDNALIVVFAFAGNYCGYEYDVLSLEYAEDGETLIFGFKCTIPFVDGPSVCQYNFVMAEVKKEDIADCTSITTEYTEASVKPIWFKESIFTFHSGDETALSDLGFDYTYYGKNSEPIVIDSRETIDALANCEMDSWDRYDPTFGEYAAKYDEAFFEDNALIVVFAMSPHPGHKYEVLSLEYAEDGQTLVFSFEYKIPVGGWPDICQFDFVMAEVKKADIANCTSITTEYSEFKNIWGDVNGDQAVNSFDYLLAKRAAFGTYTLDEDQFTRADVYMDRNYVINSADYLLIKRIAFGTYQIW